MLRSIPHCAESNAEIQMRANSVAKDCQHLCCMERLYTGAGGSLTSLASKKARDSPSCLVLLLILGILLQRSLAFILQEKIHAICLVLLLDVLEDFGGLHIK